MTQSAFGDSGRLNLEDIIAASRAETGLSNLGEQDMFPGMEVLLDALAGEAELHGNGVEAQRASLIGFLANRLRIEDTFRRHPEIFDEEIAGPIVIIGLPRSGTTKLQRMMAENPGMQKLPFWKILNPVPLAPAEPGKPDARIALAEEVSAAMQQQIPDFYAGHPMNALEPEEEVFMSDLVMRGWNPAYVANVPTFAAWLEQQEFDTWYSFLRKLLQLFQWQDGSPKKAWLLKTPEHMPHVEELFRAFPDATVVHCHRDPVSSIASLAELTVAIRRMYSNYENREEAGRFTLQHWSENMEKYLQQRQQLESSHRFVDVSYRDIAGNTLAEIERIYRAAGIAPGHEERAAMLTWEAGNPPGKHGEFHYSLDSVGLDENRVRAGFAGYFTRFGSLT